MSLITAKTDIIRQLQREVLSLQGYKRTCDGQRMTTGISTIEEAFPERSFPTGVVHELISYRKEEGASTNGFITGLLGRLMEDGGACLWISTGRKIFPPALKIYGVEPERIIFIDVSKPKEALWVIEEALKCETLAAVVGEIKELSFTESRRLQLAVEQSKVTGFVHRNNPKSENTVACVTRWKIKPLPSKIEDSMPGLGLPRWYVQLVKVRNGTPGEWEIEFSSGGFKQIASTAVTLKQLQTLKAS